MYSQIQTHPQKILTKKYSSSQSYYFSKLITNIVKQKLTSQTINYQDINFMLDNEEYMKRMYKRQENNNKMNMFKEYYYYHQDCPRIFIQHIQIIYAKWQDRKRNFMYKKLKHFLDHQKSNDSISASEDQVRGVTHFLFQLSEYNPFSKKYYLRTQPKKQKQQPVKKQDNLETRDQISFLRHDLSFMLKEMNQLSIISTLDSTRIQSKSKIYHKKNMIQGQSGSYQLSNSHNSKSIIKLNFKKKGDKIILSQPKKVNDMIVSKQKIDKEMLDINQNSRHNSPKLHPVQNKQGSLQKFKSKSIYAFTSLGQLNHNSQQNHKNTIKSKREQLKIDFDLKAEKVSIKCVYGQQVQKSNKNNELSQKKKTMQVRYNSIGKLVPNKLQKLQKVASQISLQKLKTKPDEFSDKKLTIISKNIQKKLTSYKSQHIDNKKPSFKIKTNVESLALQTKKKKLQIKL